MVIEPTNDELDDCIAKEKMRIKNIAVEKGIITAGELKEYEGKYIDQFGIDSFINYLSYAISGMSGRFVTLNAKFVKDRKEIEGKFGIKIVDPEMLNREIKNNKK